MTNLHAQAFEDMLFVLTKKTHHCLLTLTALQRKFPCFSEKNAASDHEKIEMKRIYTALQVAIAQLAKKMPDERLPDTLIPRARQEKEHITSGRTSCDLR